MTATASIVNVPTNSRAPGDEESRQTPIPRRILRPLIGVGALVSTLCVLGVLIWQGITAHGAPDPAQPSTSPAMAFLDIGVLVFREGLECILVLAALTASMTGRKAVHRRPIALGAGLGFVATGITWFIAIGIMKQLVDSVPALDLQAATGLLAVVVLVVIMNWFFHKIYWGGWIRAHNRARKRSWPTRTAIRARSADSLGIDPARLHLALSRRLRGGAFSAKLPAEIRQ